VKERQKWPWIVGALMALILILIKRAATCRTGAPGRAAASCFRSRLGEDRQGAGRARGRSDLPDQHHPDE
jgi:hypothetical protein